MDDSILRPVRAVSPVAAYVGGKRLLAKRLVPLIQSIPHVTYAEGFVGMGGVFLKRERVPKAEVINDASRDVATLFRILQRHYAAFLDFIRYQITVRAEFERLTTVDPDTLTDLERAARFLYLQRLSYGGKVSGRSFGVDPTSAGSFNVTRLGPILEALHERLAGVVIECLSFDAFIPRYDRPGTLFYFDPPYFGTEGYYGKDLFSREDFGLLAALLGGIQGRFILSLNDHPDVRAIFRDFAISEVTTTYTTSGRGHAVKAPELIITNAPDCLALL